MDDQKKAAKPLKKRIFNKLTVALAPPALYYWMKWFNYTGLRNNRRDVQAFNMDELEARIRSRQNPSIIALWHNRLPFGPTAYAFSEGLGAAVMVSKGLHGEMMNIILGRFNNVFGVRGGSGGKEGVDKGGQEALLEMAEHGKNGHDLVLTPDGPHGPRYQAKRGVIELARLTGLPIFPVSANSNKFIKAKSWDRLRMPLPYAKFVFKAGKPILVPADADPELMETKRREVETTLVELTDFVDGFFD